MRALAYLRRAPCGAACRSLGAARALATAAPAGGAFAPRLGQRVCAGWAAGAAGVGAACLAAPRQVAPARGEEPPPPAGPSGGGGSEPPGAGPRGPARGQRAAAVACEDSSSPGARPVRVALVGSTRGSSSQAVIDAIKAGVLNAEIVVVVSNKASAGILERARGEGLKAVHVPCKKGTPRAEYDAVVTRVMQDEGVDLVMLVGYMRIVSPEFCRAWARRCINIHPSLLPKHAGGMDLEVHTAVLDAKETESGCTVHLVTEEVDGGPVVVQRVVPVVADDTPESLKAKVQAEEGPALVDAVRAFGEGRAPFLR